MAGENPLLAKVAPDVAKQYYEALASGQHLSVKDTGDRGKGLFTTKALEPGDTILCERPLVGVHHFESKMEVSTCNHCFRAVGTVEQHIGGKICCLINELSEATEDDDLQEVQDCVDKIQAAVDSKFLEGLLSGDVKLPLTDKVDMAEPVKCRGGCSEEYCCAACEAAAWDNYHCLLCPVGELAASASSSSSDPKGKGPMQQAEGNAASSSSRHGAAGSSSSSSAPTVAVQQVHGVTVDRSKLAEFFEHADETNDIFCVAAQVIARTLVTADKLLQQATANAAESDGAREAYSRALSAASAGRRTASLLVLPGDDDPAAAEDEDDGVAAQAFARASQVAQAGPTTQQQVVVAADTDATSASRSRGSPASQQQQQQYLAALQAAFLPFALAHKAPWWEVASVQEGEEDEATAAELSAQLRGLAQESLDLLAAGLRDERFPQLFELQLYSSLVGMFELNNLSLEVSAPVARYKALLLEPAEAGLEPADVAAALAEVSPLLEALGDAADEPAEGTGFYALQSTINHSCAPNAAAECLPSGQMSIRALRALPAGSEVLVSYIDEQGAEREERQAMLQEYGFICSCERCVAEELADQLEQHKLTAAERKPAALAAV